AQKMFNKSDEQNWRRRRKGESSQLSSLPRKN
ncbi:hypothetical protein CEXT_716821, partial [Caerostris extrusa]